MERVTWKHTLSYVRYTARENLLDDSGNSNWGSGTTWGAGGIGREMGGRFKREGLAIPMADSC